MQLQALGAICFHLQNRFITAQLDRAIRNVFPLPLFTSALTPGRLSDIASSGRRRSRDGQTLLWINNADFTGAKTSVHVRGPELHIR